MSSSSSFRAERGRRSRDAADADDAPAAHSICGKMQSFFVRVLLSFYMCERGNRTESEKTAFFSLFFIAPKWHRQSVPLSKQKLETETHRPCIQENLQKYTRRLALTRTRLKNFYILSSEEEEEERERERGTFHSRARSFLSRREVEFPPLYISRVLKIGTLLACLPFLIKNPPRRTGDTTTQERIDKYAHI